MVSRVGSDSLKGSGFTLKKYASNFSEVLQIILVENRLEANEFTLNAESSPILGLEWIIKKDCLQVCRGPSKESPQDITQLVVQSFVSSVFDPMGIFAPFTMRMRILLKVFGFALANPGMSKLQMMITCIPRLGDRNANN